MGLALDEPEVDDETADHGGMTFMMAPDLDRFLPPAARIGIDVDAWRGGLTVRVIGQRDC